EIRKCVHCGICLPQCPTYRVLGEEMDSPRGRIYLMRAAAEGRVGLSPAFRGHLDLCLGCRACETACPSGVRFGSLLEATRAELLTGCVQRHLYPGVNRDTARLLALAGFEVVIPRSQGCCGALELHAGRADAAEARARALAVAFADDLDFVVTNAAGCGAAMKEYGHRIPELSGFAARVRDVVELLVAADLPLGALDLTVTYHDACHLVHGQRLRQEPRQLLRRIPGLRLVELGDSDLCCGSAGVYNLLEPGLAGDLLDRKLARIRETGARVVAAANPGCLLQIARGCRERGLDVALVHPVELLARAADAYQG